MEAMNQLKIFICPACNRPLRSKKSIAKGIGPVFERKLEKLKNEPDEDQLKMELKDRK
nr:DUF6011 domain-containing protein [Cytobacillus firmus]